MSSHRSRRAATPPTAVSLRRWLCAWLALLTAVQMIGSTLSLQGIWHRHRPTAQAAATMLPVIRWQHDQGVRSDAHARMHIQGDAHDHPATDPSVLPFGLDTATDAVAQWAGTVAPGADVRWSPHRGARHVQAGAASWAPTTRSLAPPFKPPRA